MTGKQSAAEWLRGIVDESYRAEAYPSCAGIARTFFGLECPDARQHGSCILMMLTAIADRIDAERAIPEGIEWPRFEDGELVKVGDEVEFDGDAWKVSIVRFCADGWVIAASTLSADAQLRGNYGERVKRPTSKVLGADGVPIEVGDTVYLRSNGREGKVVGFYEDKGETWVSVSYELGSDRMTVNTEGKALTHERPDSWEQLEEDAYHLVMSEYLETPEKDVSDIVRRAKALAKAGEVE